MKKVFVSFARLMRADFYRLFRSAAFYVIFGLMAGLNLLNILFSRLSNSLLIAWEGENSLGVVRVNSLFADSFSYGNMGLFIVIFMCVFICAEFKNNTVRNKITLGYSRTLIYFSSLIFNYAIMAGAAVLVSLILFAVGTPVLGWEYTEQSMALALYALFALLPLVALIHTIIFGSRSLGISLGVGLPGIIVLPSMFALLALFAGRFKGVEWMVRLIFLAMEEFIPMTVNASSVFGESAIYLSNLPLNASLSYILWTALFIVLGWLSFRRADIK